MYALLLFVIVVALVVYFARLRDKRRTPLNEIFEEHEAIHSVGPDTTVTECVRTMNTEKIGALLVMDGEKLIGIFTERDALSKLLAAGLDPRTAAAVGLFTSSRAADLAGRGRSLSPRDVSANLGASLREPGCWTSWLDLPFITFDQPARH